MTALATVSSLPRLTCPGLRARRLTIEWGHTFLSHAPESSFPSDHATAMWTVAFGMLIWSRAKWAGSFAIVLAALTSWARVFLGVHFPFDILGSMAVAAAAVAALVTLRALIDRSIACRIHQGVPNAKAHVMSTTGDDRPPRGDLT